MKWQMKKLGDLCKISSGGTPSRNKSEYYGGDILWAKIGDIDKAENGIILETKERITAAGLKSIRNKIFEEGTLLFAMYGSVGKTAFAGARMSCNQAILGINPREMLDSNYLIFWFQNNKERLLDSARGVALKNLSATIIRNTKIPLPPLPIQRQIAELLDTATALRQKTEAQLAELDRLAESVFLELFGDPVRNEKGWEVVKLGDLGKWQSGGTPSRANPDNFTGDIPWLSSGELNYMFVSESKEFISELAIKSSAAKLIPKRSLLLGMYDTAALKSTITTFSCTCNQAIAFSSLEKGLVEVVFLYWQIQIGKDHFRRLQRGVRQKNLNLSMVKNIKVMLPPLPLQTHFAQIIENLEAQKAVLRRSLQESEDLVGCLLQEVFS